MASNAEGIRGDKVDEPYEEYEEIDVEGTFDPNELWRVLYKDKLKKKHGFAEFELSEYAEAFKLTDILGDGILTQPQVKRAMALAGEPAPDADFVEAINKVDPQGTNIFTFQEFVHVMSHFKRPPLTEVELKETFELMDRDGGGQIDASELKHLMGCVGEALTEEEAIGMVEEADKDCSGDIDYEEFSHMILSTQ